MSALEHDLGWPLDLEVGPADGAVGNGLSVIANVARSPSIKLARATFN